MLYNTDLYLESPAFFAQSVFAGQTGNWKKWENYQMKGEE